MPKTICIFGDSIAYGNSDTEKGGWVNRLKVFLEEKDPDNEVYNLGVPGDNTEKLLERFEKECSVRKPDIIVFAIGINDSQYVNSKDNPRIPPDKFKENIKTLIGKAKKFADKIVFIGLTPVDEKKTIPIPWDKEKYYDNENISLYNDAIKDICEKEKVAFCDMAGVVEKSDLPDGLHPNSKGHEKMFLKIKEFLLEFIVK